MADRFAHAHFLYRHVGFSTFALLVISVPILSGCQDTSLPLAETPPAETAINTAEVYAPDELTIIAPINTLPGDNNTLIQVAENSIDVIQVRAQDKPGSDLFYRLQDGEDMDKFIMDEVTGDLSFKVAPDWEEPKDANGDNNYKVLWQVISSSGEARSQFMLVKVTDLAD